MCWDETETAVALAFEEAVGLNNDSGGNGVKPSLGSPSCKLQQLRLGLLTRTLVRHILAPHQHTNCCAVAALYARCRNYLYQRG